MPLLDNVFAVLRMRPRQLVRARIGGGGSWITVDNAERCSIRFLSSVLCCTVGRQGPDIALAGYVWERYDGLDRVVRVQLTGLRASVVGGHAKMMCPP